MISSWVIPVLSIKMMQFNSGLWKNESNYDRLINWIALLNLAMLMVHNIRCIMCMLPKKYIVLIPGIGWFWRLHSIKVYYMKKSIIWKQFLSRHDNETIFFRIVSFRALWKKKPYWTFWGCGNFFLSLVFCSKNLNRHNRLQILIRIKLPSVLPNAHIN